MIFMQSSLIFDKVFVTVCNEMAHASRFVKKFFNPNMFFKVADTEECSIYLPFTPDLKTPPFGTHGEIRIVGTRTPSLSNLKSPDCGITVELSGIGIPTGGDTWS